MDPRTDKMINSVNTSALLARSCADWRPVLAKECQVYVFGETYLAKRFDQINYTFCELEVAKQILNDNLYALLRFKYFPVSNDEVEKRISEIVKAFTVNLKTTLIRVSLDENDGVDVVHLLDDGQIAFRNGVYDFYKNDWVFKYEIIKIESTGNYIYLYDSHYIIQWYFNFEFDPLPIDIKDTELIEFVEMMRELDVSNRNYCFELLYNISHDTLNRFSFERFKHFCEILGYTILQSFSQNFILLIGSGQNGKNSLFDGCFTNRLIPRPAANSLDEIETDRFITGALENKAHNIFLETSAKTYTESKMIKALTGSIYQTIQNKNENKYSGVINCKYLFAGNDQEKIKFTDTTTGFRRRINIFEIFYRWDSAKKFMTKGDYYDTSFSDSLKELKDDISNTIAYIYFGMYGIMSATANFTRNFKFSYNEWRMTYSDMDFDLKEILENIGPEIILQYIKKDTRNYDEAHTLFFDMNGERLYTSDTLKTLGYHNFEEMLRMFEDEEAFISYFSENDVYISVRQLQQICNNQSSAVSFSQAIKKLYSISSFKTDLYNNKPYLKITFVNKRMKIIG